MGSSAVNYRLGDWLVEPSLNQLSSDNETHQVEPRTMDVLACLLEKSGDVVSTDDLLEQVWAGRSAEPSMVAKRISQLRRVLGDDAKDAKYISTVPRRGYRVIAAVEIVSDGEDGGGDSGLVEQALEERTDSDSSLTVQAAIPEKSFLPRAVLGLITMLVVGLVGWFGFNAFSAKSEDRIHSIAVLPLDNFSSDPSQQYIADGMTEEIITELGRLNQVRVTSRTSVTRYRTDRPSVKKIADELGVDTIIEGSVAREGGRTRVTIQLIDALEDQHIWAHSFDRDASSVLALRSEIAREVASQLDISLSLDDQQALSVSRNQINDAAYDAYLRGLALIGASEHFPVWAPKASEEFLQATRLDPDFAEPWARLALIETIKAVWISRDHFKTVREYAEKALSIDSRLAIAHTARGYLKLLGDWDTVGADVAFKHALRLNPNDVTALQGYLNSLRTQEKSDEALQLSQRLLSISPHDFHQRAERTKYFYGARRYERVLTEADGIRAQDATFRSNDEAAAYHQMGLFEKSHRARLDAYLACGEACDAARIAAEQGWAQGGYEGALRALRDTDFREISEQQGFWIDAQLGNLDKAFSTVETFVEQRVPWLIGIRYHPDFDLLRLDPRFDQLLARTPLAALPENEARTADVARLKAFRGKPMEAIAELARVIKRNPGHTRLAVWLESMAWAQFAVEDYSKAIEYADKVLNAKPETHNAVFAQLLQAASHAQLRDMDQAKSTLQQAVKLWPSELLFQRDLQPFFLGGDQAFLQRFQAALQKAGLPG